MTEVEFLGEITLSFFQLHNFSYLDSFSLFNIFEAQTKASFKMYWNGLLL